MMTFLAVSWISYTFNLQGKTMAEVPMKNSLTAMLFYLLFSLFFVAGTFLPLSFLSTSIFYGFYTCIIRFAYHKKQGKNIEIQDFLFALLYSVMLFLLFPSADQFDQFVLIFCISCIATINFGCSIRYEILT